MGRLRVFYENIERRKDRKREHTIEHIEAQKQN